MLRQNEEKALQLWDHQLDAGAHQRKTGSVAIRADLIRN